jgi:hypothetical protein
VRAEPGAPTGDASRGDASRLGAYVLIRQIGEGGMGVVHLARSPSGDRVAVKVLRPQVAGDALGRARLAREVQTLRRVSGARVAAVLDADVQGPVPYLVTRFVDGPSLDDVIRTAGPLSEDAVLHLAWGLADALCAIHDAGVVHRDLKPSNVLLEGGEPVVIDFGIAQVVDDARLTASGLFIGTPGFLAPEIVAGGVGGPASDLHAWGATVAFAATGRPPFGRGPMEVVLYNVSRGAADLDGVPDRLGPLVRGALAADPEDRIGAHELRDRLGALLGAAAVQRPATIMLPAGTPPTRVFAVPPATRTFTLAQATRAFAGPAPGPHPGPYAGRVAPVATHPGPPPQAQPVGPPPAPYGSPATPAPPGQQAAPRTRPRPGVSLAALSLLAALGAVAPFLALGVLVAGTVLARSVDREAQSLARRRSQRGPRRTDAVIAVLAAPWHLVVSTLIAALTVPLAALLAAVFLALAFVVLIEPTPATLLASGAALFTVCAWWGLGGRSVRRGTRRTLLTLAPTPLSGAVLVTLLGVAALGLALAASSGSFTWWPFAGPPQWWDQGWNQANTARELLENVYRGRGFG